MIETPRADKPETWEACVAAMQVGSALFADHLPKYLLDGGRYGEFPT